MTTETGKITRTLNLIRNHGNSLLSRIRERYQQKEATQGVREQVTKITNSLGYDTERILKELIEEDSKITGFVEAVKNNNVRAKLICAVFNDFTKQAQCIVMKGSEAQIRYFVDRYGISKTEKLVEKLIKPN